MRNGGALVTRGAILSEVWPGVVVEEGNVGKVIHIIRTALGDRGGESRYIETVAKHGYRFAAEVLRIGTTAGAISAAPVLKTRPAQQPRAYDLYMRGKVKAGSENIEDTNEAIALLEAAVGLDPTYAEAYAQLARAYNTRSFKFTLHADGGQLRDNAEVAVAKALDLDPNLAEAHFARGLILWTRAKGFPHELAIRSFKKALALKPDDDETHHQLSMVYSHVGLLDEAQRHVHRAIDLNPNNTMARFRVGVYATWQCRFEEALAVLRTVPTAVSPLLVDRVRAEVYLQLGKVDQARSIVEQFLAAHPEDEGGGVTSVKALLLASTGAAQEARRTIARAIELGAGFGHFHHTAYNIAAAYAALDEVEDGVNWIETAADGGFPCYPYFEQDPMIGRLRGSSRFVELMSRLRTQWTQFKRLA